MRHVKWGFANPFLVCDTCSKPVPYWHDAMQCGCEDPDFNYPCEHNLGVTSTCITWTQLEGCTCDVKCKK